MKWPWAMNDEPNPNEETFARNKYIALKKYAESCGWFKLNEIIEDDDNYPQVSYLTQNGTMVVFSMDEEGCKVDNRRCSESINLQTSGGEEILERLTGG